MTLRSRPIRPWPVLAFALLALAFAWGAEPDEPPKLTPAQAETRARELVAKMQQSDMAAKAAAEEMTQLGAPAVPGAIDGTKSKIARVRYWCVSVLSAIGDERGYEPVRACLNDPDQVVRAVAVWHIQRWWDKPGVPTLVLSKLNDRSDFVVGWAMKVLVARKYDKGIPRLKRLLKSDNETVRYDGLAALTRLLGAEIIPTLKEIATEDKSPLARKGAMQCVTLIDPKTPKTAEVLFLGLRDQDEGVRETAASLLRKGFGKYFQYNHRRPPITQMKPIRAWEAWYKENSDKLKWSRERNRFEVPGQPVDPVPPRADHPAAPVD